MRAIYILKGKLFSTNSWWSLFTG